MLNPSKTNFVQTLILPQFKIGSVKTGTPSVGLSGECPNYFLDITLPEGTKGEDGKDGTSILSGEGPPYTSWGNPGDIYLDTSYNRLYGPKKGSEWPSEYISLVGPQGPVGVTGVQSVNLITSSNKLTWKFPRGYSELPVVTSSLVTSLPVLSNIVSLTRDQVTVQINKLVPLPDTLSSVLKFNQLQPNKEELIVSLIAVGKFD